MYRFFSKIAVIASLILCITSCDTEDVLPSLELLVDNSDLSEANGVVVLTATLNTSATEQIAIPLVFSGTATQDSDYSLSASQIVISQGENSGSVTLTGEQDQIVEGIETLIINISETQNFVLLSSVTIELSVLDDDSDSDGDGVLDADDLCPTDFGPIANNGCPFLGLVINEVHYDPASDDPGDANGDGTRDATDDEFIEFLNDSDTSLDVSGYKIYDHVISSGARTLRHTFPSGTIIPAHGALVIFGGGTPTGNFGGAVVVTDTGSAGLSMTNSGEIIEIDDASDNLILSFDSDALSSNPNESYSRNPDLTGDFEQHSGITEANGTLFSPGTKIDGSSF